MQRGTLDWILNRKRTLMEKLVKPNKACSLTLLYHFFVLYCIDTCTMVSKVLILGEAE